MFFLFNILDSSSSSLYSGNVLLLLLEYRFLSVWWEASTVQNGTVRYEYTSNYNVLSFSVGEVRYLVVLSSSRRKACIE